MGNFGSLVSIALMAILVPLVLSKLPYFRRPDVAARRAARAQLPGWVSLVELFFFGASEVVLIVLFFLTENYAHRVLHQGRNILGSIQPDSSADLIFWLIQVLGPVIMALPLSMLLANLISWLIPPIRNIENNLIAEGAPGYTWHDLNFGLIKFSLVSSPICVILAAVSLMRL
jgi:hypothetical protein